MPFQPVLEAFGGNLKIVGTGASTANQHMPHFADDGTHRRSCANCSHVVIFQENFLCHTKGVLRKVVVKSTSAFACFGTNRNSATAPGLCQGCFFKNREPNVSVRPDRCVSVRATAETYELWAAM